nr:FAD-dependent oxidoreductase [Arthrobacter livingstonensis]
MGTPHIVVVGYGPVASRLVDELLPAVLSGAVALTVVGDEPNPAYNRVLVADLGVGRTTVDDITLADPAELESAGVGLHLGTCVRRVDRARRLVHLSDGTPVYYDRLVFATGARPVVPNLRGLNPDPKLPVRLPEGVITLRDLKDAAALHRAVLDGRRVVILGGGILGLEAALAAADEGARVTVVHHGPHTLGRSIDADAGKVVAAALRARGIKVAADARSTAVHFDGTAPLGEVALAAGDIVPAVAAANGVAVPGAGNVAPPGDVAPAVAAATEPWFSALELDDGGTVSGDLLVLSCGVRPRTELAAGSGLPRPRHPRGPLAAGTPRPQCVRHRRLRGGPLPGQCLPGVQGQRRAAGADRPRLAPGGVARSIPGRAGKSGAAAARRAGAGHTPEGARH